MKARDGKRLQEQSCRPCEGGIDPLPSERVARLLPQVPGWTLHADGTTLSRRFEFDDFPQNLAFINALAWLANRQGHHPDFTASAYHCTVNFTTHAIGGLSENDFICAARLNAIAETTP